MYSDKVSSLSVSLLLLQSSGLFWQGWHATLSLDQAEVLVPNHQPGPAVVAGVRADKTSLQRQGRQGPCD